MKSPRPYGTRLALVSEHGAVVDSDIELHVEQTRQRLPRFVMLFQQHALHLAGHPAMTSGSTWRVLWALMCEMPMRQGIDGPLANTWEGTHDDLAELTGLSRVQVTRAMKTLEEVGAITRGRGTVNIAPRIAARGSKFKRTVQAAKQQA